MVAPLTIGAGIDIGGGIIIGTAAGGTFILNSFYSFTGLV